MPNLFTGLRSSVNALNAAASGIAVSQMNMTNTGVAGYARQELIQTADAIDFGRGSGGGSSATSVSARSFYAEQAVWSLSGKKGYLESLVQSAKGTDAVLGASSLNGQAGLQNSLSALYQSFNQLRQGPSEQLNQENLVQKALSFTLTLSQTADFIAESAGSAQARAQTAVNQINGIVKGLQQWNVQVGTGATPDARAEASTYAALEKLSSLIPVTVEKSPNGSLTILMNGRTPLLQDGAFSPLQLAYKTPDSGAPYPDADAQMQILDASGDDITDAVDAGELGGLLEYVNNFVPSLLGDSQRQGDLNRLAQGVADSVNNALGFTAFAYDATQAARTLDIDPGLSAAALDTAVSGNPSILSALTEISRGTTPINQLDGRPFTEFVISTVTRVSTDTSALQSGLDLRSGLVEQAQSFRESIQGASVEESAVALLEYQRAFEASAKVIRIIDELTQTTMQMVG